MNTEPGREARDRVTFSGTDPEFPNLLGLVFSKEWRYADAGVLDRTHLRFFTLKSARRLFEECGYEVEVLRPSGPDRYRNVKRLLAPFFLPFGTDMLYMQMAFVLAPR